MASPGSTESETRRQLDLLVRRERGRLVADLVAYLGGANLALAEDVAQDALVAAMATWPYRGMPDKPGAWLARVARNKAIDRIRRKRKEAAYSEEQDRREAADTDNLFAARVADPELRLIILCCNDSINEMDQLALTLKVVSGFTAREIASVFLLGETAIAQRLARAKRKLRRTHASSDDGVDIPPSRFEIGARLGTVLKVVYLMFSLGYAPRSGTALVRRDIALEAVRIAREIADNKTTARPEAKALAALLCFQASRFDAREDADGAIVLLRDQARTSWDQSLIRNGLSYLAESKSASVVSRYHLEAGIAAAHAAAPSWHSCNWHAIVNCYERLQQIVDSPVVAVNACVAKAMVGDAATALELLDSLAEEPILENYAPYFVARAEVLCQLDRDAEAMSDFERAIGCGASAPVLRHLEQRLASCV